MRFSQPEKNISELGLLHGKVIADLGTGTGDYALFSARRVGPTGRVIAIDADLGHLEALAGRAERSGHRLELVRGVIDEPKGSHLRDASVDVAILSNMMSLLARPEDAVAEVTRILRPDGQVLVVDWHTFGRHNRFNAHLVPKDEVRRLFSEKACTVVKEFPAGSMHYGVIFNKS